MLQWSAREGCLAYREHLRRETQAQYQHDVIVWALLEPHRKQKTQPPRRPRILGRG